MGLTFLRWPSFFGRQMRRIIASEFVSADGFIVGPKEDMSWVMNNFNEEMGRYAGGLMVSMDTVLLGRVTYEIMAGAWPNMTEDTSPGADRMNSAAKVVVSKTLVSAPWGKYAPARVIRENVEQQVKELKQGGGKNIGGLWKRQPGAEPHGAGIDRRVSTARPPRSSRRRQTPLQADATACQSQAPKNADLRQRR